MQVLDSLRPEAQPEIAAGAAACGFSGPWLSALDEREELRVAAEYHRIWGLGRLREGERNKLIAELFRRTGLNGPAFLRIVARPS